MYIITMVYCSHSTSPSSVFPTCATAGVAELVAARRDGPCSKAWNKSFQGPTVNLPEKALYIYI